VDIIVSDNIIACALAAIIYAGLKKNCETSRSVKRMIQVNTLCVLFDWVGISLFFVSRSDIKYAGLMNIYVSLVSLHAVFKVFTFKGLKDMKFPKLRVDLISKQGGSKKVEVSKDVTTPTKMETPTKMMTEMPTKIITEVPTRIIE
jgi:hypothetical protein